MSSLKSVCIDDNKRFKNGDVERNIGSSDAQFPLHKAARKYDCVEVKSLLDKGWDPDVKDDLGRTVLHVLLGDGFLGHLYEANMEECVQLVLGKCDVNAKDSKGETPLSLAVTHGFESCAILLVQNGADSSINTTKYKRMLSLQSKIAKTMPKVMIEILNYGVTLDYVINDKTSTEPEAMVKLDWGPVLQFPTESDKKNGKTLRRHKYTQRETAFLYSLLDVSPNTRNMFLTHPLVSAFLHVKANAVSRNLKWLQMLVSTYPIFYMIFIYFLYFNRCKLEDFDSDNNQTSTSASVSPSNFRTERASTGGERCDEQKENCQYCEISWPISLAAYVLMVVVVCFGFVELYLQFRVNYRYLKSWRTWVLRVSLVIMGLTLWPALQFDTLYNITWQYPVAALGTFFAWVLFLIQMELIPQVKIYLEMLVAITLSVLKITLLFMPLLIGFYMGFNLMFFDIGGVMNFILMTVDVGSEEYEEMVERAKDSRAWFTIIAYTFSVAFIIIIAIVFMNFLLGVSINDIQELKHNAKIMALSNKIQNLFIIDLVFPTNYNVVPEGQSEKRYFSYGPYDRSWKLPEDIRTQITLLLKSKYSTRPRLNEASSESTNGNEQHLSIKSTDKELMSRISRLETKLRSIIDEIRADP